VLTGWFSEFSSLDRTEVPPRVEYGSGAARFAGATYDPTAHYRGASVFDFHAQHGLEPLLLREISRHQVGLLKARFEGLDIPPAIARVEPMPDHRRAGFLAMRAPRAREVCQALRERGVVSDFRGDRLRLGPAPYLTDSQLHDAIDTLFEVIARLR
jgi:kynureninase